MHNKHLIRLWMLLVFVALASGAYLLLPNSARQKQTTAPVSQNLPWENVASNTVIAAVPSKTPVKPPEQKKSTPVTTSSNTTTPPTEKNTLDVTIEINNQKYPLSLAEKSSAYDAMIRLVAEKKITAVFKEFSGLGYFVDEIDGIRTDKNDGKYWIYYINGQSAQLGISQYILKNNDLITWQFKKGI